MSSSSESAQVYKRETSASYYPKTSGTAAALASVEGASVSRRPLAYVSRTNGGRRGNKEARTIVYLGGSSSLYAILRGDNKPPSAETIVGNPPAEPGGEGGWSLQLFGSRFRQQCVQGESLKPVMRRREASGNRASIYLTHKKGEWRDWGGVGRNGERRGSLTVLRAPAFLCVSGRGGKRERLLVPLQTWRAGRSPAMRKSFTGRGGDGEEETTFQGEEWRAVKEEAFPYFLFYFSTDRYRTVDSVYCLLWF